MGQWFIAKVEFCVECGKIRIVARDKDTVEERPGTSAWTGREPLSAERSRRRAVSDGLGRYLL